MGKALTMPVHDLSEWPGKRVLPLGKGTGPSVFLRDKRIKAGSELEFWQNPKARALAVALISHDFVLTE